MLEKDPQARSLIAKALGDTIDKTVKEHLRGISQEPAISSRVGQSLETELNDRSIFDQRIRIVTQDFPDRGPKALEKSVGADLYIGIAEIVGQDGSTSKGLLVQSKLTKNLRTPSDFDKLHKDCEKMLARSEASYVWLYENSGVRIVHAREMLKHDSVLPPVVSRRKATTLFSSALACTEGDFGLGLPGASRSRQAVREDLGNLLKDLRMPKGISVTISGD